MRLFINPLNLKEYAAYFPQEGMIAVPSMYREEDLQYLIITQTGSTYEFELDIQSKLQQQKQDTDRSLVLTAHRKMSDDINTEMKRCFGVETAESAVAYELTYRLILENPSKFTKEEVKLATDKQKDVISYIKYRLNRIEQFRLEKKNILGE